MNVRRSFVLIMGLILLFGSLAYAGTDGKIVGVVTDSNGAVAGAYVSIKSAEYEDADYHWC